MNYSGGNMRKLKTAITAILTATAVMLVPVRVAAFTPPEKENEGDYLVLADTVFDEFDARIFLLEHKATGAKVEVILNDDPDKFFMLEFETPPSDNKGTAHVFEHSAMNGSVKYPSRSLSSALRNRSYTTYLNAFTKEACTIFPVASLSEKQLLKLADYYTDLCFEPMILEDEDIFRSEAWRLSLDDPEGQVKINGTIYSEMTGKYTADTAAVAKAMGLLYPSCASSYIAGGIPQAILSLKYDEVKAFHEKYYTPSNCTAYLYGDINDPEAFLDLLDGYFDAFAQTGENEETEKDSAGSRKKASPSGYREMKYLFPAPSGADDDTPARMVYAVDLGSISDAELSQMYALAKCLNLEQSKAMMTLRTVFPGSSFSFSLRPDAGNVAFTVTAQNMAENEAPYLRQILTGIFSDMASNGIDEAEMDIFKNRMETDAALAKEGDMAAINLLQSIANYSSGGRGPLFYIQLRDMMADMDWFTTDMTKKLCRDYLSDPMWSVMSVVINSPQLYEKNQKELTAALEKISSSMTEDDRESLIADTERITAKASDDPSEYLDEINVIKVSDLSDTKKKYAVKDETDENGVRTIGVYGGSKDIMFTRLYLDASGIPEDMVQYLALYTDLVNGGFVDAGGIERSDIPGVISGCTAAGQEISLIVSSSGQFTPYVTAEFSCAPGKLKSAYEMLYSRMFESSFEDPARVKEGISAIKRAVKNNIANNPDRIACFAACSEDAEGMAYYDMTHYTGYYDFLCELENNIGGDFKNICAKLDRVSKLIHCRDGAVIGYSLPKTSEDDYLKAAKEFTDRLDSEKREKCTYGFEKHKYPLAVVTDGNVVSNAVGLGDITQYGYEDDSPALALALTILSERYIKPATRGVYGTYSTSCLYDHPAVAAYTGNDPVTDKTFDIFANAGKAWKEIREGLTQDDVDDYIIMMYSKESRSYGSLSDSSAIISDMVSGKAEDNMHKRLEEIKKIKVSDLKKYDVLFEKLSKDGRWATVGSRALIDDDKKSYAQILDPFAK